MVRFTILRTPSSNLSRSGRANISCSFWEGGHSIGDQTDTINQMTKALHVVDTTPMKYLNLVASFFWHHRMCLLEGTPLPGKVFWWGVIGNIALSENWMWSRWKILKCFAFCCFLTERVIFSCFLFVSAGANSDDELMRECDKRQQST